MQPQKSSGVPVLPPPPAAPGPVAVADHPPEGRKPWWLLFVVAAIGIGAFAWYRAAQPSQSQQTAGGGTRTVTVQGGKVIASLRLTGTTGAEKYASLLVPQLRGSRSGFGRDGRSFSSSTRMSSSGGGSTTRSSSAGGDPLSATASSSSSSASRSGGSSADASGAGSSAGAGGAAGALGAAGGSTGGGRNSARASSSRIGSGGARAGGARSSAGQQGASNTMGNEGLGNTSNLPGQGGGGGGMSGGGSSGGGGMRGGGGSEFMVVLQDAAKPGTIVKKGQVIAEFDRQYMLTRLDDYKASVIQTEASFKKLASDMELTKKTHEQTILTAQGDYEKALLDMKTLPVRSAMDSERLRLALEEAQARLKQLKEEVKFVDASIKSDRRVAELEVEQSRIELRRAEANVARLELKAPIDGLVVMQNTFRGSEFDQIKVGDQLYPGMMFMQVVDPSSMIISATVSQVDVEKVRIGMKTRVRFDAFPGLELPGHIQAIGSVAKSSRYRPDWVKEIPVRIKLDQMDMRVIPDLSVSCDVILDEADAPAVLPREAVFTDRGADGKESKPYVWVRAAENSWQRREVELGSASFTHVAVRTGLRPREVVAVEKPEIPKPGERQVS